MKVHMSMNPMFIMMITITNIIMMNMMKKVMGTSMEKWMQISMVTVQACEPYKFLRQECCLFL